MPVFLYSVVCDSGLTVRQINDAAAPEAVLVQHMLHHRIVMMGVDADIGTLFPAEFQHRSKNPFISAGCDSMNRTILLIRMPSAVKNLCVGGIWI